MSKQAYSAAENAKKALKKSKKHRAEHSPSKEAEMSAREEEHQEDDDDVQTEELDIKLTAEKAKLVKEDLKNKIEHRVAQDIENNRLHE